MKDTKVVLLDVGALADQFVVDVVVLFLVDLVLTEHTFDLGTQVVVLGLVGRVGWVVPVARLEFEVDNIHLNVNPVVADADLVVGIHFNLAPLFVFQTTV